MVALGTRRQSRQATDLSERFDSVTVLLPVEARYIFLKKGENIGNRN